MSHIGKTYGQMTVIGERWVPCGKTSALRLTVRCELCGQESEHYAAAVQKMGMCSECRRAQRIREMTSCVGQEINGRRIIRYARSEGKRHMFVVQCLACGVQSETALSVIRRCGCPCRQRFCDGRLESETISGAYRYRSGRKINANNSSGVRGVSWSSRLRGWRAYITFDRRQISLGVYADKERAIDARRAAEIKYYNGLLPEPEYGRIPEGYISIRDYAVRLNYSPKSAMYHYRAGHFPAAVPIGESIYLPPDTPWPGRKR